MQMKAWLNFWTRTIQISKLFKILYIFEKCSERVRTYLIQSSLNHLISNI